MAPPQKKRRSSRKKERLITVRVFPIPSRHAEEIKIKRSQRVYALKEKVRILFGLNINQNFVLFNRKKEVMADSRRLKSYGIHNSSKIAYHIGDNPDSFYKNKLGILEHGPNSGSSASSSSTSDDDDDPPSVHSPYAMNRCVDPPPLQIAYRSDVSDPKVVVPIAKDVSTAVQKADKLLELIIPREDPDSIHLWVKLKGKKIVESYEEDEDALNIPERKLSMRAKQHLLYHGWTLYYTEKSNKPPELRYSAPKPSNKIFVTLLSACLNQIEIENSKPRVGNRGEGGHGSRGGPGGGGSDWVCSNPTCANSNFARTAECNRCGTPGPGGGGQGSGYHRGRSGDKEKECDETPVIRGPPPAAASYEGAYRNHPPPSNPYVGREVVHPPTSCTDGPYTHPPSSDAVSRQYIGRGGVFFDTRAKVKQCDETCDITCDNARIYISNLPPDVTTGELERIFGGIGQVGRVKLLEGFEDDSGKTKGHAVLSYEHPSVAHAAWSLYNNHELRGYNISVAMAEKSAPGVAPTYDGGGGRGGYVGGGDRHRDNHRDGRGCGPDRKQHGGNRSRPY